MKKNIYVICVATILGLIFLYYKSAIDKKIDSSRINLQMKVMIKKISPRK